MSEGRGPTALVTGATGFIGRHLTRRLAADGCVVHALARRPTSTRAEEDPTSYHLVPEEAEELAALVRALSPTVCFHLATDFRAQHRPGDVTPMIETNVALGARLAEALSEANRCPLVYAGTAWQHFEGRAYSPTSLYAATKQALQDLLVFYAEVECLPVAVLTLFDTYGPGDSRPKLVPLLLEALRSGTPVALSSGDQLLDLLHVDDAVEGLLAAASYLDGGGASPVVFSAHTDAPVTVRRLVDVLSDAAGTTVPVQWGARPARPREMRSPWRFADRPPGWAPRVPLRDGLRALVAGSPTASAHDDGSRS